MKTHTALFLALLTAAAHAGTRTSANYTVPTDTADAGGKRTASASYTNDGSVGAIAGLSIVAAPAEALRSGYAAQIYDVTGLTLTAATLNMNEASALQLAAFQVLDDATFLAVPAASVAWSVVSGPLATISAGGLATAGAVFENTAATAGGSFSGLGATLALTVLDTVPDNFGTYAADGLPDSWQNQFFGLDNPLAAPSLDPDGDGQTNAFEFTFGLAPTDNASHFSLNVTPGQNLTLSPIVAGRSYVVEFRTSLMLGDWAPLTGFTQNDAGSVRTITDTTAPGVQKFYRVRATTP